MKKEKMMRQMPRKYTENLALLKAVSHDVNSMIEDGTFYELPFIDRHLLVSKIKRLYNKLSGRFSALKLQHILAAASLVVVGACAKADDTPAAPPVDPPPPPGPIAFAAPVTNAFGLTDIGYNVSPTFADIDNDGDLDALIGEYFGDTIYFTNTGSATVPAFAAAIANPFGLANVGWWASPAFVDIDNDGDLDAFIGNGLGHTMYFTNTGTASVPTFATKVTNPFGLTDVGMCATPEFKDIDNDGDLDAFIGNFDGNTVYFINTGSAAAPVFGTTVTNPFGLTDVGWGAFSALVDIDNDGDPDAFIGEMNGNTIYFANTGSATAPAFATAVTNPFGLTDVGDWASPALVDIDNDGDLDAFIGNWDGDTLYFQNTQL